MPATKCPQCGEANTTENKFCGGCGVPLTRPVTRIDVTAFGDSTRQTIEYPPASVASTDKLLEPILSRVRAGYQVIWRNDSAAQLRKPKPPAHFGVVLFALLVGPIACALVYLKSPPAALIGAGLCSWLLAFLFFYWISGEERSAFIYLDAEGNAQTVE